MRKGRRKYLAPLPVSFPEPSNTTESNKPIPVSPWVGQSEIIKKVESLIEKVKASGGPFPHTLLIGEEGLGKDKLAHFIAHAMGSKITVTSGPAIEREGDLIGILTNLGDKDILFVDNFQQLSKAVREYIYPALETRTIDFVIDKGPYAKTINFRLKRFTLIATIPDETALQENLRIQFICQYRLTPQSTQELHEILTNELRLVNLKYEEGAVNILAEAAKGNPGRGVKIIRGIAESLPSRDGLFCLTEASVREYLQLVSHNVQVEIVADLDRRIPEIVKRAVWRRDQGQCVKCRCRENLEFDHIIPISKGGSNTARNIELLCERCNREKSDQI